MKKRISIIFALSLIVTIACGIAQAADIMPYADIVFDSATAYLAADKYVTFDCEAWGWQSYIMLTQCSLEQKINGSWVSAGDLPVPPDVQTNTLAFGLDVDYSAYIGSGTFRICFTVEADGHAITRYSNSRTFP